MSAHTCGEVISSIHASRQFFLHIFTYQFTYSARRSSTRRRSHIVSAHRSSRVGVTARAENRRQRVGFARSRYKTCRVVGDVQQVFACISPRDCAHGRCTEHLVHLIKHRC